MINREDMLELTRRMTPKRTCFSRIAGCYLDADGFPDGSFNTHFGKLSEAEKMKNLKLAKTIPFSRTNVQLKEYACPAVRGPQSIRTLLAALREKGLKDDALLSVFYEVIAERYAPGTDYAVYMFFGTYDIPVKGTDGEWMEGSEEIYDFLIGVIAPLAGEYEPGEPVFGFLYPAFSDRSADPDRIDIFHADPEREETALVRLLTGAE